MSKLVEILDYVVSAQDTLHLTIDGTEPQAVKRKLPKREEKVDPSLQVCVTATELVDDVRRIGFGSKWQCLYVVLITLITPNDRDQLLGLDDHAAWREGTRAFWQRPGSLAPVGCKRVEIVKAPFLDRAQLANGYDYNQVALQVTTYEARP